MTDARAALLARLRRVLGRDHLDAVHLDLLSALLSPDLLPHLKRAIMEAELRSDH